MNKLKIEYISTDELIPYINNPRENKNAVDQVAASIKEFGFKNPIIVDKDNVIVAGHTRLLASRKLGIEEVPVIKAEDLTEKQVKAFRIADNKTSEFAEWDMELLEIELEDIDDIFTGFDMEELEDLFGSDDNEVIEDDFDEEPPENPISKKGDIWLLGRHRLMCGDSTTEDVNRLINGNQIDLIFTDPPYNVAFNGRSGNHDVILNDNLTDVEFNKFIIKVVNKIKEIKPKAYYVWCNWKFYSLLQDNLEYKTCIVWAKNVFGMGNGYRHQHEFCLFNGKIDEHIKNESDLWEIKKDSKYMHPTQKPVTLSVRAFSNHIRYLNVLDLFGGSGSTLIGAEQTGRKAFVMELDPKYCDVIVNRYIKFKETDKDVYLIRDGEQISYSDMA